MGAIMKRALLLWLVATTAQAAPKIEFDRMVYDFGKTSLVDSVTGKFTYRNTGDEALELQPPKPSCGCTVAKLTASTLQPGESGEMEFNMALGFQTEQFQKGIYVSSNDPQQPMVTLLIKVDFQQVFKTEPPSVSLGSVQMGASTSAVVIVRRLDGQKAVITKAEASGDAITASVEPSEGDAAPVRISLKPTGRPRLISEQVKMYSADSKGAACAVFVTARLLGDIQLDPEALGWGMPDPEHWNDDDPDFILERSFTITATQPDWPLTIRNVSCTLKEVKLKLETLEKDKQFQITASLDKPLKQPIKGMIAFETNLPSLPKVEVPIEINVWRN
jgi:hypothetical protein